MAQPSRTQTLNDKIIMTTDTYISTRLADVVFEHQLLFGALWGASRNPGQTGEKPGRIPVPAGRVVRRPARELWIPIATESATTVTPFQNADTLPTTLDPVGTVQRFNYAYYTAFAGISWQEAMENKGSDAVIDLLQSRIDMTFRTFSDTIETDLWASGDGTTVNANEDNKRVLGIQHVIADDPTTGTVWNINRATYTYQRNQTTNAGSVAFASTGLDDMRSMITSVTGTAGTDRPSVIVTTPALFEAYTKEAENIHQITSTRMAELGFDAAVYQGIPITYTDQCPAGTMYFLNLRYWYLCMPPGADFASQRYDSPPDQAMAALWRVFLGMQWGVERFDRQGVIYGYTDT